MGVIDRTIDRFAEVVTAHNRIVLLVMLLATAGILAGIPMLDMEQQGAFGDELEPESDVAQAAEYIDEHYGAMFGSEEDEQPTATSTAYVRDEDGDVLTRAGFLEAVDYQIEVTGNETVAAQLAEERTVGPQNLVGAYLAGDPDADLHEQRDAIERASDEEIEAAIRATLDGDEQTQALLPTEYDPDTAASESFRMEFTFAVEEEPANNVASPPSDAQRVLFDAAEDRDDPEVYTMGEFAQQEWGDQQMEDTLWLVLVPALVLILGVLTFAYRNPIDVVIGFVGVVLSVLWMFGIIGWLGIPMGMTIIVGPVLIIALSIDFGLHVFNRYREHRGPDVGIRDAMSRGTGSVATAFLLVTITAAVGFLANLTSPLSFIQELGVGITLGVVSAFVIFVTVVPALKISADGLVERLGLDTRQTPLGHGRFLRPVLETGVHAARIAAPVVIVLALVVGAAGGLAYAELDREGVQQEIEASEWKTELPGPMSWDAADTEYRQNLDYQQEHYQATNDFSSVTRFLVEGDPTDPETLHAVDHGHDAAQDTEGTFEQGDRVRVQSPLTLMEAVAATDEEFAEVYHEADTTDDGVPDENLAAVYDELFEVAPEQAAQFIEHTEDGEYRTVMVYVPVEQTNEMADRSESMHGLADEMEASADIDSDDELAVTPVGFATLNNAELAVLADDILETMLLALAGVLLLLAGVYRFERGSATLGVTTVIPIVLVLGMVFGAMYLFDVPLTFLTALLMSITIGLGIDYNIHVSDRFAQELEDGRTTVDALLAATTGTGGALLGSALTSGAAFLTLMLHPSAQIESFGAIVVFALLSSFLLSVFVLPSLLYVWAERIRGVDAVDPVSAVPSDD